MDPSSKRVNSDGRKHFQLNGNKFFHIKRHRKVSADLQTKAIHCKSRLQTRALFVIANQKIVNRNCKPKDYSRLQTKALKTVVASQNIIHACKPKHRNLSKLFKTEFAQKEKTTLQNNPFNKTSTVYLQSNKEMNDENFCNLC